MYNESIVCTKASELWALNNKFHRGWAWSMINFAAKISGLFLISIKVTDWNKYFILESGSTAKTREKNGNTDLEMTSENIMTLVSNHYGANTLLVNEDTKPQTMEISSYMYWTYRPDDSIRGKDQSEIYP